MRLVNVILLLSVLVGCQNGTHIPCDRAKPFPEHMVGVWESDQAGWAFRFEPDGSIKKFRHMLAGESIVADGGVYFEGPDPGTYAMYVYGECSAQYEPCEDRINVVITLDKLEMQLPEGMLEGHAKDLFTGLIPQAGDPWIVEWRTYSWLKGSSDPDIKMIDENPVILTFTRLDIQNTQ